MNAKPTDLWRGVFNIPNLNLFKRTASWKLAATKSVALLLVLAGHVLAVQEPVDERVQQLQRDQALIEALVCGGLDLAGEDDPLQRANHCNRIADALGKEVRGAVGNKDDMRAALLGKQMQDMLEQGVASNLNEARAKMVADAATNEQINNLGKKVAASARSIVEQVGSAEVEKWRPMIEAVNKGKTAVDQAVKSKGKPK
jgi:hypothetical protein